MDELVGKELDFYGVDNHAFKLGDVVYEAIEDESDGYRSCLGSVEVKDASKHILFKAPIAEVIVKAVDDGYFQGHHLVDTHDGHIWLMVGTDDYDDYYPCFVFRYEPKAPTS